MERRAEGWKPLVKLFGNVPDETSPIVDALFPDTKLAKHAVKQVFSGGLADDFADGVCGDA